MAKKRKQRKFNKRTGELKGLKAPNNKDVPYLPSAKTIANRRTSKWSGLRTNHTYPTGTMFNPRQQDSTDE